MHPPDHIIKFRPRFDDAIMHKDKQCEPFEHAEDCIIQLSYKDSSHQIFLFYLLDILSFFQLYSFHMMVNEICALVLMICMPQDTVFLPPSL